ncbi:MAG: hypothetical protein MJ246_05140 [Clostridia bacterium]|nr:hypothetical protein [Clostridia bacterium]
MKKIFSILILTLVVISAVYLFKEGNVASNVDTVEELIETASESDDINECIVLTRSSNEYSMKKITINFNNQDITSECLFEVKYKTEVDAKNAYDEIMESSDNEEVMLDGTLLTYKNNVLNLIGMKKEDAIEEAKEQVESGIFKGYKLSIEKVK